MRQITRQVFFVVLVFALVGSCKKEEVVTDTSATDTSLTDTSATEVTAATRTLADCSRSSEQEFVVDVTFTGLVTFMDTSLDVSQPLPGPISTARNLKVLIPDVKAGDSTLLPPGVDQHGIPHGKPTVPHTPFIGTDVQYICENSTTDLKTSWCASFQYHELKNEDIEWDAAFINSGGASNPSPLSFPLNTDGDGICPMKDTMTNKDDTTSLHWVPSLSRIGAKGEKLDPMHFATGLLGTSTLSAGRLEACVLSPQKLNLRPTPSSVGGSITQVVAEEVHYFLRGKGKTFTVTLQPTSGSPTTLVLKPVKGRVELRVGNLPENFIPVTEITVSGTGAPDKFDSHFGVYHRVLADKGRPKEIPFDAGTCANFPKCSRAIETRPCANSERPSGRGHPSTDGANCGPNRLP